MKNYFGKRALSLLVALIMVMCTLPTGVFAQDNDSQAQMPSTTALGQNVDDENTDLNNQTENQPTADEDNVDSENQAADENNTNLENPEGEKGLEKLENPKNLENLETPEMGLFSLRQDTALLALTDDKMEYINSLKGSDYGMDDLGGNSVYDNISLEDAALALEGDGSESAPFEINNEEDLYLINVLEYWHEYYQMSESFHYKQMANIDMDEYDANTPEDTNFYTYAAYLTADFNGVYDGNGYEFLNVRRSVFCYPIGYYVGGLNVKDIFDNYSEGDGADLFTSQILNVTIREPQIDRPLTTGAPALAIDTVNAFIYNCKIVGGTIYGNQDTSALIRHATSSAIDNCSLEDVYVNGERSVSGIAFDLREQNSDTKRAYATSIMYQCSVSGELVCGGNIYVGGLTGYTLSSANATVLPKYPIYIKECSVDADITITGNSKLTTYAGAFVGDVLGWTVLKDNTANGSIDVSSSAYTENTPVYVGKAIGAIYDSKTLTYDIPEEYGFYQERNTVNMSMPSSKPDEYLFVGNVIGIYSSNIIKMSNPDDFAALGFEARLQDYKGSLEFNAQAVNLYIESGCNITSITNNKETGATYLYWNDGSNIDSISTKNTLTVYSNNGIIGEINAYIVNIGENNSKADATLYRRGNLENGVIGDITAENNIRIYRNLGTIGDIESTAGDIAVGQYQKDYFKYNDNSGSIGSIHAVKSISISNSTGNIAEGGEVYSSEVGVYLGYSAADKDTTGAFEGYKIGNVAKGGDIKALQGISIYSVGNDSYIGNVTALGTYTITIGIPEKHFNGNIGKVTQLNGTVTGHSDVPIEIEAKTNSVTFYYKKENTYVEATTNAKRTVKIVDSKTVVADTTSGDILYTFDDSKKKTMESKVNVSYTIEENVTDLSIIQTGGSLIITDNKGQLDLVKNNGTITVDKNNETGVINKIENTNISASININKNYGKISNVYSKNSVSITSAKPIENIVAENGSLSLNSAKNLDNTANSIIATQPLFSNLKFATTLILNGVIGPNTEDKATNIEFIGTDMSINMGGSANYIKVTGEAENVSLYSTSTNTIDLENFTINGSLVTSVAPTTEIKIKEGTSSGTNVTQTVPLITSSNVVPEATTITGDARHTATVLEVPASSSICADGTLYLGPSGCTVYNYGKIGDIIVLGGSCTIINMGEYATIGDITVANGTVTVRRNEGTIGNITSEKSSVAIGANVKADVAIPVHANNTTETLTQTNEGTIGNITAKTSINVYRNEEGATIGNLTATDSTVTIAGRDNTYLHNDGKIGDIEGTGVSVYLNNGTIGNVKSNNAGISIGTSATSPTNNFGTVGNLEVVCSQSNAAAINVFMDGENASVGNITKENGSGALTIYAKDGSVGDVNVNATVNIGHSTIFNNADIKSITTKGDFSGTVSIYNDNGTIGDVKKTGTGTNTNGAITVYYNNNEIGNIENSNGAIIIGENSNTADRGNKGTIGNITVATSADIRRNEGTIGNITAGTAVTLGANNKTYNELCNNKGTIGNITAGTTVNTYLTDPTGVVGDIVANGNTNIGSTTFLNKGIIGNITVNNGAFAICNDSATVGDITLTGKVAGNIYIYENTCDIKVKAENGSVTVWNRAGSLTPTVEVTTLADVSNKIDTAMAEDFANVNVNTSIGPDNAITVTGTFNTVMADGGGTVNATGNGTVVKTFISKNGSKLNTTAIADVDNSETVKGKCALVISQKNGNQAELMLVTSEGMKAGTAALTITSNADITVTGAESKSDNTYTFDVGEGNVKNVLGIIKVNTVGDNVITVNGTFTEEAVGEAEPNVYELSGEKTISVAPLLSRVDTVLLTSDEDFAEMKNTYGLGDEVTAPEYPSIAVIPTLSSVNREISVKFNDTEISGTVFVPVLVEKIKEKGDIAVGTITAEASDYPSFSEAVSYTITDKDYSKVDVENTYFTVTFQPAVVGLSETQVVVAEGESVTVPAAPARNGYTFLYWEMNGNPYKPNAIFAPKEDCKFVAKWSTASKCYSLTINKNGGNVQYVANDGTLLELNDVTQFVDGTTITLRATDMGRYRFREWIIVGAAGTVNENEITFTINQDVDVNAVFRKKTSSSSASTGTATKPAEETKPTETPTTPVIGAVDGADETVKATATEVATNTAAANAANAVETVALVNAKGTTVSGKDFTEPAVLKIPVDTKGVDNVNNLTLAKFNAETGKLEIVGGSYDSETNTVTGYIDEAGDYFVVEKNNLTTITLQIGNNDVTLNNANKALDAAPIISQDRTMVPLRFIAEAFGAQVTWVEATKSVIITMDGKVLTMTIDKELEGFGAAPVISNGRTMVPLRYISEALGANVIWVPSTQTVSIAK